MHCVNQFFILKLKISIQLSILKWETFVPFPKKKQYRRNFHSFLTICDKQQCLMKEIVVLSFIVIAEWMKKAHCRNKIEWRDKFYFHFCCCCLPKHNARLSIEICWFLFRKFPWFDVYFHACCYFFSFIMFLSFIVSTWTNWKFVLVISLFRETFSLFFSLLSFCRFPWSMLKSHKWCK